MIFGSSDYLVGERSVRAYRDSRHPSRGAFVGCLRQHKPHLRRTPYSSHQKWAFSSPRSPRRRIGLHMERTIDGEVKRGDPPFAEPERKPEISGVPTKMSE